MQQHKKICRSNEKGVAPAHRGAPGPQRVISLLFQGFNKEAKQQVFLPSQRYDTQPCKPRAVVEIPEERRHCDSMQGRISASQTLKKWTSLSTCSRHQGYSLKITSGARFGFQAPPGTPPMKSQPQCGHGQVPG
eukprot:RCo004095